MPEYIERKAFLDTVKLNTPYLYHMVAPIALITPTADVQEVKHGEWVKNKPNTEAMQEFHKQGIAKAMSERSIYWTCSCCNSWGTPAHRYCQNCGAKMDKG